MTRSLPMVVFVAATAALSAQSPPPFQTDFPVEEFQQRRGKVMDAIGGQAIAIVQGAPGVDGFKVFRQSNEFYYLTGLESPHAYLVMDGRTRRTTVYLSRRNEALEGDEEHPARRVRVPGGGCGAVRPRATTPSPAGAPTPGWGITRAMPIR